MSNLNSENKSKINISKFEEINPYHKNLSFSLEIPKDNNKILQDNKLNISHDTNYINKNDITKEEIKNNENEKNLKDEIKHLLEENNSIKLELEEYKNKNLEFKYRELLLDYQKIETQNNELIEQNELLKNKNDEISKDLSNYKNKYNLILKEQKKTKNSLEEITLKYNSNISFVDKFETQKLELEKLVEENRDIKNKIEEKEKQLSNIENELKNISTENQELKDMIKIKKDDMEKNIGEIKTLKNEISKLNQQILKEKELNLEINNKYNIVNGDYALLKEQNDKIKNDFEKENKTNLVKIKTLEISNENYIKEINEIKSKNENQEYQINYVKQLEIHKDKNSINEETYNEEINKLKKEIDTMTLEISNLKIKLSQKDNENNNLIVQNEEMNSKINKLEKDSIKSKEEYDNIIKQKDELIIFHKSQINKINEDLLDSINKSKNDIQDLNNYIQKISYEKNHLLSQLKDILLENSKISEYYQENLNKLRNIRFLNNEENENDFILGILEPKNIFDFISKCSEEIIKLINDNYILKNNINDLDLKLNLKKEQINDYEKEIFNLKSIINNYCSEFDNKNKIFNEMKKKNNDIEQLFNRANNDKKFLLDILLRIGKLFPNSKIGNLLYNIFDNNNNNDLNLDNFNEKEIIYKQIFKEIQLIENYVFELRDKPTKFENIKNKSINNNIIINNNTNNIESINSVKNIKNLVDKIYIKQLYKKNDRFSKTDGKIKHK